VLDDIRNTSCPRAPTRSRSTPPRSTIPSHQQASLRFGSQCIVVGHRAKRVVEHDKNFKPPLTWADEPKYAFAFSFSIRNQHPQILHVGGLTTTAAEAHGIDAVAWAKKDGRSTVPRDPADDMNQDGQKTAMTWN